MVNVALEYEVKVSSHISRNIFGLQTGRDLYKIKICGLNSASFSIAGILWPIGSMVERPPPTTVAEGCGFESHVGR